MAPIQKLNSCVKAIENICALVGSDLNVPGGLELNVPIKEETIGIDGHLTIGGFARSCTTTFECCRECFRECSCADVKVNNLSFCCRLYSNQLCYYLVYVYPSVRVICFTIFKPIVSIGFTIFKLIVSIFFTISLKY